MWIVSGALSVIFCIIAWITVSKKQTVSLWASVCSLAFVALTLLMEYRLVLQWVNEEYWVALMDVVPTAFTLLSGYVIILLSANTALLAMLCKKKA